MQHLIFIFFVLILHLIQTNKFECTLCREEVTMDFQIGEIIKLKKKHPCGSFEWEILRVGMDFRLRCLGCNHQMMISRKIVEKNFRGKKD